MSRKPIGERHGAAKICDLDAWVIKNIDSVGQKVIAYWFGVSQQTVSRIRSGKNWKHIEVGL